MSVFRVLWAASSWRTASLSRARFRADAAAPGVDVVRHRTDPGLRSEQRLIVGLVQPLGRLPFLGHLGQQTVQVGVGLGQVVNAPSGSAAPLLCASATALTAASRAEDNSAALSRPPGRAAGPPG